MEHADEIICTFSAFSGPRVFSAAYPFKSVMSYWTLVVDFGLVQSSSVQFKSRSVQA